jgi:glucokinase
MSKLSNIIGVDLGGTNIRVGKIIEGEIVKITKVLTPSQDSEIEVLEKLFSAIESCLDNDTTKMGIGVPSVVDPVTSVVYEVQNIPAWKEVPLRDLLIEKFGIPVFVNNDANCFVAGEKIFGKGKEFNNIVGMTIGTGLGLGLIINGKIYAGRNCGAGEICLMPYLDDVYETYCSGQFFSKINQVDGVETFQKALAGDQKAIELFNEFGKHIGATIKTILYAYDPEIVIIGGSLTQSFEFYKKSMNEELQNFAYPNTLINIQITTSELADSAIYGAAALG